MNTFQENEFNRYQEFLAYKRQEIVNPLGMIALAPFASLGAPVSRFETVLPVERYVEDQQLSEKLTRPMGAVTLRSLQTTEQPPLNSRAITGYAPEMSLAA